MLPLRCGGSGQADRVHSEEAKMINRKFKRMVSVFLCFAVAAGLVPLSAAAVEKQPEIVSELTEMRDEYEKHFLMSDVRLQPPYMPNRYITVPTESGRRSTIRLSTAERRFTPPANPGFMLRSVRTRTPALSSVYPTKTLSFHGRCRLWGKTE